MQKTEDLTFTQALTKLKEIAAKLDNAENIELEEGLTLIEEGIQLHKLCKEQLEKAQIKLTKLFDQSKET